MAGAISGVVLLNRTDRLSNQLLDDIQPARVAAYQLQAALRIKKRLCAGMRSPPTHNSSLPTATDNAPSELPQTASAACWGTAPMRPTI